REFVTVTRWRTGNTQMSNPFHPDAARVDTIAAVKTILDSPQASAVVRIEGRAGVGKTRLALEIAADPRYEPRTIYALNAENPEVLPFLSSIYSDPHTYAIAILDECSVSVQERLASYAQNSDGRLKLLCVGLADVLYDALVPSLTPVFQLKPLHDSDIR